MEEAFCCEALGRHVVVRLAHELSERALEECQLCLLETLQQTGSNTVLYDLTAMAPAPVPVLLYQRLLNEHVAHLGLRRAIVVPNTQIAHLARLAFGGDEYRLFYDNLDAAVRYLDDTGAGSRSDWSIGVLEERRVRDRRATSRGGGRRERDRAGAAT